MNKIDGVLPVNNRLTKEGNHQLKTEGSQRSISHSAVAPSQDDNVHLTGTARQLQKASELIQNAPDVDVEKIEQIKAAIADGSYSVDAEAVAEKLLALESSLFD